MVNKRTQDTPPLSAPAGWGDGHRPCHGQRRPDGAALKTCPSARAKGTGNKQGSWVSSTHLRLLPRLTLLPMDTAAKHLETLLL